MALSMINALYRIEREIKDLDSDEKYEQRQKRSIPALKKLKAWLDKNTPKVAKGGLTRTAMDYALNQWPKLKRYCKQGVLHISNVLAENAIRPFVIGRKSWLFADTPAGAKASALYYSLIETAKANDSGTSFGLSPLSSSSRLPRVTRTTRLMPQQSARPPVVRTCALVRPDIRRQSYLHVQKRGACNRGGDHICSR